LLILRVRWLLGQDLVHHQLELLKVHAPISILVDFAHNVLPDLLRAHFLSDPQHRLYLLARYRPRPVLVERLERLLQLVLLQHHVQVYRPQHPLRVVDLPGVIHVDFRHDFFNLVKNLLLAEAVCVHGHVTF